MVIRIEKYQESDKELWNNFVSKAKNSHFFFQRDYMDYHADRFEDFSLLFFTENDEMIAMLPANIKTNTLYSHQGLSFGALLVNQNMKAALILEIFETLISYLKKHSINKLVYKALPYIYHLEPAQEDLYALSLHKAKLVRRDLSSTIDLTKPITIQERRKRSIKKAIKAGLNVIESKDYSAYWQILAEILEVKYEKKPVHSLEEIELLVSKFPENIKLFTAVNSENKILAGIVTYENQNIVHAQYIANSSQGQESGALDLVVNFLIEKYKDSKQYFDFGISTENNGEYLNTGLVEYKEGFGARAVTFDFYELEF